MRCELFEYASEQLDTGVTDIDAIETDNSLDTLLYQIQLESGDIFKLEDSSSLILESFATQKSNQGTDTADFLTFNDLSDILDFSEGNPFGELGD